ncbi:hypothetical protein pb186bvf_001823 [Paramecium bursaria]
MTKSIFQQNVFFQMKEYNNIEQRKNQRILIQQKKSKKITSGFDIIKYKILFNYKN